MTTATTTRPATVFDADLPALDTPTNGICWQPNPTWPAKPSRSPLSITSV